MTPANCTPKTYLTDTPRTPGGTDPAKHHPPRGPWLAGASGEQIDLIDPDNTPILLPTVLHALAQINRFGGHAFRPYSVLEHSVMVGEISYHLSGQDPMARACGMFHDAHEAYVGDMPSPMKRLIGDRWEVLEQSWAWRVRRQIFGEHAWDIWNRWAALVKRADVIALYAERRALLPGVVAEGWGPHLDAEDRAYSRELASSFNLRPAPTLSSAMLDSLPAAGLRHMWSPPAVAP